MGEVVVEESPPNPRKDIDYLAPVPRRAMYFAKNKIQPKCVIDRSILNDKSLVDMDDIGLSFFARLCGNNRGVFVVEPSDGKTYG